MELGISTGIFYQSDLIEGLPAIRAAGFRKVELCVGEKKDGRVVHYDWRDAAYTDRLRIKLLELGLEADTFHAPYSPALDPAHPDKAARRAVLDELSGVAKVMKTLGARTMVLHPAVSEFNLGDAAERRRRLDGVKETLPALLEVVKPLGFRVALENLLPHLLGGDMGTLKELAAPFGPDAVGYCFDTSHANLWGGEAVYRMLDESLPRLMTTHLSDNRGKFDDHFVPGEGSVDWGRVLGALKKARYEGLVLLEVFRDSRGSAPADVLRETYARAKQFLS